nr:hypothetical protein [Cystobacter fuscus]
MPRLGPGVQEPAWASYTSTVVRAPPLLPPATSTLPDGSNVAVSSLRPRPEAKPPAELHVLVAGSYTTAVASRPVVFSPPTTSTCPDGSRVAVCACRATGMGATAVQVPAPGS